MRRLQQNIVKGQRLLTCGRYKNFGHGVSSVIGANLRLPIDALTPAATTALRHIKDPKAALT
jgi:hypothetical protein